MAKKEKKKKEKPVKKESVLAAVKFTKKNTLFFGIGLILVIVGFILLAAGDIVLAPILLVVGYLVFFPLGILLK
ncbi:hypothetical protein AMJ83_05615 [candidate division WOR_3 bacterium SM23_42]|uniref:DUF3098 domain-containing protein n=1 Tax=candidate division WOR_3 bacterium SM23_42 TaxID=1703779 RepID=A0A0S8FSC4_UNCW3|nr:MAG: hypothetical protein AMJ83_05615 [candidate division WOR_3 bacterium SM23_42]